MLTVERLTKKFSNGKGIFDVSFHVQKGEVFGFLGPNGAGKSTTIRHIMGFMKPDQGDIKVNGMNVRNHSRRHSAAYRLSSRRDCIYRRNDGKTISRFHGKHARFKRYS